jgi:hypothetical protein
MELEVDEVFFSNQAARTVDEAVERMEGILAAIR